MISFKTENFNANLQEYEKITLNLEVKRIRCPDCGACDMERHGYYYRTIYIFKNNIL